MPDIIPWYYKAGAAAIGIAVVLGASIAYFDHRISLADKAGYDRSEGEWKVKEAAITLAAHEMVAQANDRARADTDALQDKFNQLADQRQKEKDDHEVDKKAAVSRALAGVERLHIPTGPAATDALPAAGNSAGAGSAGGSQAAPSADLLPETAAVILDVAGDYGQLVRDYNAVVDRYQLIEHACNAQRDKLPTATTTTSTGE